MGGDRLSTDEVGRPKRASQRASDGDGDGDAGQRSQRRETIRLIKPYTHTTFLTCDCDFLCVSPACALY